MKITKDWLTKEKACKKGMNWFAKNYLNGVGHEELYQKLVAEQKYNWAGWLCMRMLPTTELQVEFAIRCVLKVYTEESFVSWANNWLNGTDRSVGAAREAASAAREAESAAREVARKAARVASAAWAAKETAWAAWAVMVAAITAASAAEAAEAGVDLLAVMAEMEV